MPLAALIALTCLCAPRQQDLKEELTVKGMRLFARCWRTPTGQTPYMIWTIGSRDDAPKGEQWVIRGEYIGFEGLEIQPTSGFTKPVKVADPDSASGPMVEQPGGEKAVAAIIRGRLERVATLEEELPLGEVALVKSSHKPQTGFPTPYHFQIDRPTRLTTPSGLTIDIPIQGAGTTMKYLPLSPKPMAALLFKPSFKEEEAKIPESPLFKRLGGPITVEARMTGIGSPSAAGFVGGNYVIQTEGFDIKPGPAKGAAIVITQTIVLESYPLDFRVPVRDSK